MRKNEHRELKGLMELAETDEGILVFDGKLRPIHCNRFVKPLCLQTCRSGTCVVEKREDKTPALFKIVQKFKKDCQSISVSKRTHRKEDLVPYSIVYFSPEANYTLRCIRLDTKKVGERIFLWKIILQQAIAFHNFDFDLMDGKYGFTDAELRILKHCLKGTSNSQIAKKLFISLPTVKTHVKHILRKLGISKKSQIISRLIGF